MVIEAFEGKHRFLSNFFPATVKMDGCFYASVEHAYQAAKFPPEDREAFRKPGLRAGIVKEMGRGKGGDGWHDRSLPIMLDLLRQKFQDPKLQELLLATGDAELIEGNWWGDTFFGVCEGVGDNHLGKMLMHVRREIREAALAG